MQGPGWTSEMWSCARHALEFPARFQLMAAMNPCPCGYLGHPERNCIDTAASVARYQAKVSGPLLDRMDLIVPVVPVPPDQLASSAPGEGSEVFLEFVEG